jgi:predicted dehydrogenase
MINVGVVGLGFMGVTHIKAYRSIKGARLAAICDPIRLPTDGVLGGVSGNVGTDDGVRLDMTQLQVSKDIQDLLANPDLDLIDLCVPTVDHVRLSKAALEAGKHVICEKPLARTAAQAREIVAAADAARTYFMPAMCMRFWPGWSWLREAVQKETYGKPLAARFRRVSSPPGWSRASYFKGSESGGALLDLHIHDTDFVQFVFGRPERVVSTGISRFSGAIDHVVTQYQVANGACVYAEGTWMMTEGFPFNMTYTFTFERATADFDLHRGAEALRVFEEGKPMRVVACDGADGYVGELTHMLESIERGTPPSVVTARDALSAVEICEAEERSVQSGQWEAVSSVS